MSWMGFTIIVVVLLAVIGLTWRVIEIQNQRQKRRTKNVSNSNRTRKRKDLPKENL